MNPQYLPATPVGGLWSDLRRKDSVVMQDNGPVVAAKIGMADGESRNGIPPPVPFSCSFSIAVGSVRMLLTEEDAALCTVNSFHLCADYSPGIYVCIPIACSFGKTTHVDERLCYRSHQSIITYSATCRYWIHRMHSTPTSRVYVESDQDRCLFFALISK